MAELMDSFCKFRKEIAPTPFLSGVKVLAQQLFAGQ
jgi:hypothetical protein